MRFWRTVFGRVSREALNELRLNSPSKVVQAILPPIIGGVGSWFVTGHPAWTILWFALGLFANTIYWFTMKFVAVPAAMDAELRAEIGRLTPTADSLPSVNLRPDTPLHEAIRFAAIGTWDCEVDAPDDYLTRFEQARQDFHQLAADGHIHAWYREHRDGVIQRLERSAWAAHRTDPLDLLDGKDIMRRRKDGTVIETCHDIAVCREEMEQRWPYYRSKLPGYR